MAKKSSTISYKFKLNCLQEHQIGNLQSKEISLHITTALQLHMYVCTIDICLYH